MIQSATLTLGCLLSQHVYFGKRENETNETKVCVSRRVCQLLYVQM